MRDVGRGCGQKRDDIYQISARASFMPTHDAKDLSFTEDVNVILVPPTTPFDPTRLVLPLATGFMAL